MKLRRRRHFGWGGRILALVVFAMLSGPARAQDANNPEELNRRYQDALAQLKAAQDRKNELATENEKLNARVADLERQLEQMRREATTWSEQTWRLRMHYAAWESFLRRSPEMLEKWKAFLERDVLSAPAWFPPEPGEPAHPTTAPSTMPTAAASLPAATTSTVPSSSTAPNGR